MKARQLLADVLVEIGANGALDTPSAPQLQIALRNLNRMLDGWQADRLFVYAITEVVATVSGPSATIGPGLQFDCPAPQSLHRGCYYVRGGQSFDIAVWDRESYNSVVFKTDANDYPDGVFYDRMGQVFFTMAPSSVEMHLQVFARLPKFADLDTDYTLPDGYEFAIYRSLCELLPPLYTLPVAASAPRMATAAKSVIRKANVDVPVLRLDGDGGGYNILTNQP